MTSLFGRMLPLFIGVWKVEDLFTEAVARLFERRPDICLGWLEEIGAIFTPKENERRYVRRVSTQKSFVALEEHGRGSRPDMLVEISRASDEEDAETHTELVMFESKLGSWEGPEQLKRYAAHLENMSATRKTLVYITRAYDPKDPDKILAETEGVSFRQLRWHDFYKFLQTIKKDALVEEVMLFMEEQGMSRSHRLSATDLMALSGVLRAFEVFDEIFGDEVEANLKAFAGNNVNRREPFSLTQIRDNKRFILLAPLHGGKLYCYISCELDTQDSFPEARFYLEAAPTQDVKEAAREASVAVMKQMTLRNEWDSSGLSDPTGFLRLWRGQSLANLLHEEDHIAAIKNSSSSQSESFGKNWPSSKRRTPISRGTAETEAYFISAAPQTPPSNHSPRRSPSPGRRGKRGEWLEARA